MFLIKRDVLKTPDTVQGFLDKVGSHFWRIERLKLAKVPFLRIPILSRMNQQVFGTIPFLASSLFQICGFSKLQTSMKLQ